MPLFHSSSRCPADRGRISLQLLYSTQTTLGYQIGNLAHGMANNGMTDAQRAALSPSDPEYDMRVIGSKIQVAGWSCYSTLMLALKLAMLFFYLRLTVCFPFFSDGTSRLSGRGDSLAGRMASVAGIASASIWDLPLSSLATSPPSQPFSSPAGRSTNTGRSTRTRATSARLPCLGPSSGPPLRQTSRRMSISS
jgi:hypothetical protein